MELPNIAAYAYQDVHVWSALLTCLWPPGVEGSQGYMRAQYLLLMAGVEGRGHCHLVTVPPRGAGHHHIFRGGGGGGGTIS